MQSVAPAPRFEIASAHLELLYQVGRVAHSTKQRALSPSFWSNEACDRPFGSWRLCETRSPRHIGSACCARPASGHAAAPPSSVINSRRRMGRLPAEDPHYRTGSRRPEPDLNNPEAQRRQLAVRPLNGPRTCAHAAGLTRSRRLTPCPAASGAFERLLLILQFAVCDAVCRAPGAHRCIFLGGRYEDAVTRQNAPVATGSRWVRWSALILPACF